MVPGRDGSLKDERFPQFRAAACGANTKSAPPPAASGGRVAIPDPAIPSRSCKLVFHELKEMRP
ncbi:hypothetical protein RRH01S_12_01980 [Rhizobium rhizogenes NBRC 13257]|uniref:Uncharacterized protein n=1 Tax=Rhizobium rhizogenes NBRC 13257 TaxID=1220581 RepID=A0AA87Q4Y7_RHIRH|nr:hypothetical protein RRH01S_12_01980 [Rhizobium rhizogenes NBRC 13257]